MDRGHDQSKSETDAHAGVEEQHDAATGNEAHAKAAHTAVSRMARGLDASERALAMAKGLELVLLGLRDINELTDGIYWALRPEHKGEKIPPGSPEAKLWLEVRDGIARPALEAAPPAKHEEKKEKEKEPPSVVEGPKAAAPTAPAQAPAPAPAQAPAPAAAATATTQEGPSGGGADHYFAQGKNSYDDDHGKWNQWGAAGNTCNMTSLAMSLVSMAGGDENRVRQAVAAKLREGHLKPGARAMVGEKMMPVATILKDDGLLAQVAIADLLDALAAEASAKYDVTSAGRIVAIAEMTGLVDKKASKAVWGDIQLDTKQGREMAKQKLAAGEKIVLSTPVHFIYLVDVTDDGVLVHDPAGARLDTGLEFVNSGTGHKHGERWLSLVANYPEVARRRVSHNPQAKEMVERLVEISKLKGKARQEALAELQADGTWYDMGAFNFYDEKDYKHFQLSVQAELAAAKG